MSEPLPDPTKRVCDKCDGSGWVYIPVSVGRARTVQRVRCNCRGTTDSYWRQKWEDDFNHRSEVLNGLQARIAELEAALADHRCYACAQQEKKPA